MKRKKELLAHSKVVHGTDHDRVYVLDYQYMKDPYLINQLDLLSKSYNYGKVLAKIPIEALEKFARHGYEVEAKISGFYNGLEDCFFVARYNEDNRKNDQHKEISEILHRLSEEAHYFLMPMPAGYKLELMGGKDMHDIATMNRRRFKEYPKESYDEAAMLESLKGHVVYVGLRQDGPLIGALCCDMNMKEDNVEFKYPSILSKYEGKQYMYHILKKAENVMQRSNIKLAYAFVNAKSWRDNALFSRSDYTFGGTLWNNVLVDGVYRSENIWYKHLLA